MCPAALQNGRFFCGEKNMKSGPELPISVGEHFLVRDAEEPKPITANVTDMRYVENADGIWQKVGLRRISLPRSRFELITSRRISYGAYTNRDGRYCFLRVAVLPFEELLAYFDNGTKQAAEEFIKNSPGHAIIDETH
jgi:hypothetical protein